MLHILADNTRDVNGFYAFFVIFINRKFIPDSFLIKKTASGAKYESFASKFLHPYAKCGRVLHKIY